MKTALEDKTKYTLPKRDNSPKTGCNLSKRAHYVSGVFRRIYEESFGWMLGTYKPGMN